MFKTKFLLTVAFAVIYSLASANLSAEDSDSNAMTIGSKAPAIDIEHWVSDNDGAYEHTTALKSDRVYVIEFWATWCGPCISAMPHIADVQKEYGDKVQVISVSDEDTKTVDKFLKRKVRGKKDMTYAELTKGYCLTTDPDKSVKNDYFRAAGRTGIPCAFIVGKTGYVEWIGHPMKMDKPLESIVNGKWDREEHLVEYKKEQAARAEESKKRQKVSAGFKELQGLIVQEDKKEAIEKIDEMLEDKSFARLHNYLKGTRVGLMVSGNLDGADEAAKKFIADNSDNVQAMSVFTKAVLQEKKNGKVKDDLFAEALKAAASVVDTQPTNSSSLYTYAQFLKENDQLDKAIEIQEKAVEHARARTKPTMEKFLKKLQSEK